MDNVNHIAGKFLAREEFCSCKPYGSGYIHETYMITKRFGKSFTNYILQKFNTSVFREPEKVLENIKKITTHLKNRTGDRGKAVYLSMIPAPDKKNTGIWMKKMNIGDALIFLTEIFTIKQIMMNITWSGHETN